MRKLKIRLITCWKILTRQYNHWVIITIDEPNLIEMARENNYELQLHYHGLQEYNVHLMVKEVAKLKDEADMVLEKASFYAEIKD